MTNPSYNNTAINQAETVTYAIYKVTTAFTVGSDTCSINDILQFVAITDTSVIQPSPTVSSTVYRGGYFINLNTQKLFTFAEVPQANITLFYGSSGGGGAVTNDGTFATPAKQDTGNASLVSIATNTTGLATATAQSTGNSTLSTIVSNQTNGTQQTIVNSSALPTGASTSALQTTMASSQPVAIANNQSILLFQPGIATSSSTIISAFTITTVRGTGITNSPFVVTGASATTFFLHGYYFYNSNGSGVFVNFYNSSTPTIGTTTPLKTVYVPPNSAVSMPVAHVPQFNTSAISGISIACVTTITGSTAPATAIYAEIQSRLYS